MELPEMSRLEALELRPDDIVLLTVPSRMGLQELRDVKEALVARFPANETLVIVEAELAVLRPVH